MQNQTTQITTEVLKKITPSTADRERIQALALRLEQKISEVAKQQGVSAVVRVEGSVAKDTWITENPDIDIFVKLPTSIPRENLGEVGLKIAKFAAGDAKQIERYAEHPYLEIIVEGMRVDIVPCYNVERGEWKSATDRTPFHTDYIHKNLPKPLLGDVRLLKKYMQGTGVYSAEVKIGGFSGYLCELLVMQYKSFVGVVEAFAKNSQRTIIDIEGYYYQKQRDLNLLFPEQLVVVDPVDKARNVASAVQPQKLNTLIGASRAFLKKPAMEFFYPPIQHALSTVDLKLKLENRGSSLMFLVVKQLGAVPDVLWGQLYRTKRSLTNMLELADFAVLKDAVWSNEENLSVFVFELETQTLPAIKKHVGPPLNREIECEKFLAKYVGNPKVVSGPAIEEDKWVVELPRKNGDAAQMLRERLVDGGKNAGVADLVAKSALLGFEVLVADEVENVYVGNAVFAEFLSAFIVGKPFWLQKM